MVLFEEDLKTKRVYLDVNTRNLSFIRMSKLLKEMNVKNNKFFLTIYQPELMGIDPFDPSLSEEQKLKIVYECKINPWYFFREVLRIGGHGGDPIPYILNRANLSLMWCFYNRIASFLTMPRQIGKTIGTLGILTHFIYVASRHTAIGGFAKGEKLRRENVARIKEMRDALPDYFIMQGSGDSNNKEDITYGGLDNKLQTYVAQKDRKAAAAMGRGDSHAFQTWDEVAYFDNINSSFESATAATNAAQPSAWEHGIRCADIFTTTAGRLSTKEGQYAHKMINKAMRFNEMVYDCKNIDHLNEVLKTNSGNQIFYLEYSYSQLGKDDAWFERVTRTIDDQTTIDVDYLNKWVTGSDASVIPPQIIDKLMLNKTEPVTCTFVKSLILRWYVDPSVMSSPEFKNKPFIIGMDTSDNVGKDFTTIVLLDSADMSVLMTCRCNQSNLAYVAQCLTELLEEYPRSIFIPERNKNGAILIDFILTHFEGKRFDPFKRIYNTYNQDFSSSKHTNTSNLSVADPAVRKQFGFNTNKGSREVLFKSVLMAVCHKNSNRMFDKNLIDEIAGLTVRNGRVDHGTDSNDDTLVAYLIASWFIMFGRNFDLYGISPDEILSNVSESGEDIDPMEKERQKKIKDRIAYLQDLVDSNSISRMMKMSMSAELNQLKRLVKEDDTSADIISVQQIKEVNKPRQGVNVTSIHNLLNQFRMAG